MSQNSNRIYKGVVKNGTVVLGRGCHLPEGTSVEVRVEGTGRGSPEAVLAAVNGPPHVEESAVEELMKRIEEGRRPVRFDSAVK